MHYDVLHRVRMPHLYHSGTPAPTSSGHAPRSPLQSSSSKKRPRHSLVSAPASPESKKSGDLGKDQTLRVATDLLHWLQVARRHSSHVTRDATADDEQTVSRYQAQILELVNLLHDMEHQELLHFLRLCPDEATVHFMEVLDAPPKHAAGKGYMSRFRNIKEAVRIGRIARAKETRQKQEEEERRAMTAMIATELFK